MEDEESRNTPPSIPAYAPTSALIKNSVYSDSEHQSKITDQCFQSNLLS